MRSRVRGKLPIALAVTALIIAVLGWSTPAIAHGVRHALFAHNADKVDGKHANQLVRTAQGSHESGTALTNADTTLISVSITAPKKGFLLVNATGTYSAGAAGVVVHCGVEVDDGGWSNTFRRSQAVTSAGVGFESCDESVRFTVAKGAHIVDYEAHNDGGSTLTANGGSMTVEYVPFGATGHAPARVIVARPARGDVAG